MATDFLGNEYGEGDIIVYAAMFGRSINMIKAEVVDLKDNGSVVVQPLAGSRWGRHGDTRYIDTRTGKGIDPYATDKHTEVEAHRRHKTTGETISNEEYWLIPLADRRRDDYEYVSTAWKDYVKEELTLPKRVTLTVTENIVLLEKKHVD